MTSPRPFEQRLEAWLDDGPTAAPSDLLEAAYTDIPATYPQRRRFGAVRRFPMLARSVRLVAAIAAVAVVGVIGFTLLRGLAPIDGVGGSPTPSPTDVAVAPTDGAPTGSPEVTIPACRPVDLALQVTSWDGAAGHRIAAVTMTNTSSLACSTLALDRPQLVAGADGEAVLINGAQPAPSESLVLKAGGTFSTLVQDGNYCGPEVTSGPVTVAFVLSSGAGRVVAEPLTSTDRSGLPPCNGNPGSAGTIEMHPWAP